MPSAADLTIPVVWSEECLRHEPGGEVWLGVRERGTELPERAEAILAALRTAGAAVVPAVAHDDEVLRAVHDDALIEHLRTVWAEWEARGYVSGHGRDRVLPYVFPTAGMLAGLPLRLCRPPGHHAGPGAYGGSCYLNNAAVAAEALRRAGAQRVAIIDVDAHHGNGTQAIFYHRADVYYGSLHIDPGAGWFPHYAGYAAERGSGAGEGANRNLPLAPGTGDAGWLAALDVLCAEAGRRGIDATVVSLRLDAAAADPESPLQVTSAGYRGAGERLGRLGPAVLIQEGGYDLTSLGGLVVAVLTGAAAGAAE